MGYDHSLSFCANFKEPVTIPQVIAALKPLAERFGWNDEDMAKGILNYDNEIDYTRDGDLVTQFFLYTCGQVSYEFPDTVEAVANNLGPLCEADQMKLTNHDTGDVENAVSSIWFGDPDEIDVAKKTYAWELARYSMASAGVKEEVIAAMNKLFTDSLADVPVAPRPRP